MTNEMLANLGQVGLANLNAAQSIAKGGGMGILKDPFDVPQQLVLTGEIAISSTKTYFYMDDSCGLAGQLGLVSSGATAGQAFTATTITIANLQAFLQTHALVFGGYNFQSSNSTLLSNNLTAIYSCLDGNNKAKQLFSAQSVSNMQQNANLLNVDQPFVMTNATALKIGVTSNASTVTTYTFTFKIIGAVPYGKLDEFLAAAQVPERSKLSC